MTRYLYGDACGPVGATPDWSACSAHADPNLAPVVDYGTDQVVTLAQTEADFAAAIGGDEGGR